MERIDWKRIRAVILLALGFTVVATMIFGSIVASTPSYAEVTEGDIKLSESDYKVAAEAACSDSIKLAPATLYYIDSEKAKEKYQMTGMPYADSYATGISSPEKDAMLAEVMDELCGNPSALYATLNGLQYVMDKSFDYDFFEANPWAADYVNAVNEKGMNQFVTRQSGSMEWMTSDDHREVAAAANMLLLRWDNAGVVTQQTTIANWADLSRGQIFGEMPKPGQRKEQENLPALKLTLSDKDYGCVTAIGFNTSDKRFEVLDCGTTEAPAPKPKPTEVTVTPESPKETPKEKPKEKPKPKPTTPKETPKEKPKPKPTTPKETPEETPTTPVEKPTTPPKETPTTHEPPTPTHTPSPEPMPTPEETPKPTPEPTPTEEPTPEPEPSKTPEPKSSDPSDYKAPGDGDERDSGEGTKPVVPKVTEKASDPKPVETEKVSQPDRDTGKTTKPKITDSPTNKPGSETGVTAPGAEPIPDKEKDSGKKQEEDKPKETEVTQPTEEPDPVVVDDGSSVNDEEVSNPF